MLNFHNIGPMECMETLAWTKRRLRIGKIKLRRIKPPPDDQDSHNAKDLKGLSVGVKLFLLFQYFAEKR